MRNIVLLLAVVLLGGCAASDGLTVSTRRWARVHGGSVDHHDLARLQQVADELAPAAGLNRVELHILNETEPAAYAWPANDVFLTTGLIEAIGTDELEAAMAHELAHLAEWHGYDDAQSLDGRSGVTDIEQRADALGMRVLIRAGRDPDAMLRMLHAVRDGCAADDPARPGLDERIAALGGRSHSSSH